MKRLSLVMLVLMAFGSLAFAQKSGSSAPSMRVQSGDYSADVSSEGWALNGGSGNRTHMIFVSFPDGFTDPPKVSLSITKMDSAPGKDGNMRISVKADKITRDGFVIKINTWGDSRVAGVEGNWVAVGR